MFNFLNKDALEGTAKGVTLTPSQTMEYIRITTEKGYAPTELRNMLKAHEVERDGQKGVPSAKFAELISTCADGYVERFERIAMNKATPEDLNKELNFPRLGPDITLANAEEDIEGLPPRVWCQRWGLALLCMIEVLSRVNQLILENPEVYKWLRDEMNRLKQEGKL